jgi:dTDP-4-dehydrorhamnose reductase
VFGAGGQLGRELVKLLGEDAAITHDQVSILDAPAVAAVIAQRKPDVVFNCAAYNAVDRAEEEPDLAFAVNADGPFNLAVACRRHGATLAHFSTNFVFDGTRDEPYLEADEPAPLSAYGRSKLEGERRVLEAGGYVVLVRTAGVFGGRQSFPYRILDRARAGQKLSVVADQRVNPTYAKDLAAAAVELVEIGTAGIVHAVAEGCPGWDDFARATLEEFGVPAAVESVSSAAYPSAAPRPLNGCLGTTRYRPLRPWREALREWALDLKNP